MRVVLDCNVVVSAARNEGICREIVDAVILHHRVFLSHPVIAEYKKIARRPKHASYRDEIRAIIEAIGRVATVVEPVATLFHLRDPDDEVYLATAVAGSAALVTGNRRDFTKPRYGSVEILSPRAFLERMN